jgi:hypothetical protein
VGPAITQNDGPTGSVTRSATQDSRAAQPHASIPTTRRRSFFPCLTKIDPRRVRVIAFARRVGWRWPKSSKQLILLSQESKASEGDAAWRFVVDAGEVRTFGEQRDSDAVAVESCDRHSAGTQRSQDASLHVSEPVGQRFRHVSGTRNTPSTRLIRRNGARRVVRDESVRLGRCLWDRITRENDREAFVRQPRPIPVVLMPVASSCCMPALEGEQQHGRQP